MVCTTPPPIQRTEAIVKLRNREITVLRVPLNLLPVPLVAIRNERPKLSRKPETRTLVPTSGFKARDGDSCTVSYIGF